MPAARRAFNCLPFGGLRRTLAAALLAIGVGAVCAQVGGLTLTWAPPQGGDTPPGWAPLTFKKIPRHTRYSVVREAQRYVLKAESEGSASGLIYRLSADPRRTPVLRWQWRVGNVLRKADVTHKDGDDYPARVYVAFAYDPKRASLGQRIKYEALRLLYGEYPPHSGLNYIWDTRAPVGTIVPNAFTDRVRMVVVETGHARVGQWLNYERNLYDDYKRAFGEEPPTISGVAVMTDTDGTGESATAWYGDISLSPASP